MLGYQVSERTVSRYLERIRPQPLRRRSQTWKIFLRNQAKGIVCVDLFTVQTVRFQTLYIFVILHLESRKIVGASVTRHPNAHLARPTDHQRLPVEYGAAFHDP